MKKSENALEIENGYEVHPDRVVLETPVVTVKAGPVVCKRSGKKKDLYLFDFPDWVNVVALTPQKEILLIRQYRYGSKRMELEIPGGMMNADENPIEAGCRELLEETGFAGKNPQLIGRVCPNPAIQRNYCHTVLVEDAVRVAEPNFDDMEDIECLMEPEREVMERIQNGSIEHGLVLNALMFYQSWRK